MKKKLFLLVTCFFLFSSLVIFLTYRNVHLSEITKEKEEEKKKLEGEVKRLLKELEEQKEKSNSNQEDHQKEKETDDDLPWALSSGGATLSLVVCALVAVFSGYSESVKGCFGFVEDYWNNAEATECTIDIIIFVILFFILFPFLLAIFKYKDKSYWKRYRLLWRSYWKPFVCVVLSCVFGVIIVLIFFRCNG